jgi:hypothetical protein
LNLRLAYLSMLLQSRMASSILIVKDVLASVLNTAISVAIAQKSAPSAANPAPATTASTSASASALPASSLASLPVLRSISAQRRDLRTVTLREGPHSHFTFAQPALELVPDKLACAEWVRVKASGKTISALMTDVTIVSGPNAKAGHSWLVCDIYVKHFEAGSAMRVELLLLDSAAEQCCTESVRNVENPTARSTPPPLSAKLSGVVEAAEKHFEGECLAHAAHGRTHIAPAPSAADSAAADAHSAASADSDNGPIASAPSSQERGLERCPERDGHVR